MLHTWSQTLTYHPHLHCIVPGGGLSPDGHRWISSRNNFLVPVKVLSALFRGKMMAYLKQAYEAGELIFPGRIAPWRDQRAFDQLCGDLYGKDWVVYCKPPFATPEKTLDYLARYTHRVALTNQRLIRLAKDEILFRYRDSADNNRIRRMQLPAFEFIRRFLLHILPDQFIKIRHYGLLSNRCRTSSCAGASTCWVQSTPSLGSPYDSPGNSCYIDLLESTLPSVRSVARARWSPSESSSLSGNSAYRRCGGGPHRALTERRRFIQRSETWRVSIGENVPVSRQTGRG